MQENVTGIVLDRALRGESGVLFRIFSAESGIRILHKRVSKKKTAQLPDIFDVISAEAERSKTGGVLFLKDFERLASHARIAENYEAFECAAEIAKCALKNCAYLESCAQMYEILRASFGAIGAGADPVCVRIKFMYVFARGEGYPVKEDFAANLSAAEFEILRKILKTPAAELSDIVGSRDLLEKMARWVGANTDIEV